MNTAGAVVLIVCIFAIVLVAIIAFTSKKDIKDIVYEYPSYDPPMYTSKEIKVTTTPKEKPLTSGYQPNENNNLQKIKPPSKPPKNLDRYLGASTNIPSSTKNIEVKTKTQVKKVSKVKKEKPSKIDFILAILKISGPKTSGQLAKEILKTYPGKSLSQNKNYTSVMLCHLKNRGKIERQMDGTYILKKESVAKAKKSKNRR